MAPTAAMLKNVKPFGDEKFSFILVENSKDLMFYSSNTGSAVEVAKAEQSKSKICVFSGDQEPENQWTYVSFIYRPLNF